MLKNYRVRKAAKLYVAEQGESDFVKARGFTHERHLTEAAKFGGVDRAALEKAVVAQGLQVARKYRVRYEREDGEYREITLSALSLDEAEQFAHQRLKEQYGEAHVDTLSEAGEVVRERRADLDQENYRHVATNQL